MNDVTGTLVEAQALLFDLDGVILDSTMDAVRRWRAFCVRHGLDEAEVLAVAHGQRTLDTVAAYLPADRVRAETDWFETLDVGDDVIGELPGVRQLLSALDPDWWCIVTSCPRGLAVERLTRLGLPVPGVLVTAEDVAVGKPSPVPYQAGLAALGVEPHDALVFEDAPSGVAAGRAAGIRVVTLLTTHDRSVLNGSYVIADLSSATVLTNAPPLTLALREV